MSDFSIPEGLPQVVISRLNTLYQELLDGDITEKGYRKHREQILAQYGLNINGSVSSINSTDVNGHSRQMSGFESLLSYQMANSPQLRIDQQPSDAPIEPEISPGMENDHSNSFGNLQGPVLSRGIPETANTDPLNIRVQLSTFDNLPSILRHRAITNGDMIAFQYLDEKGRENMSITWGKLASKAEKVAQMLREHSGLFRGDCVVLFYSSYEVIEFFVALMGCFLAGLVAVPASSEHAKMLLNPILKSSQSKLVLTTDHLLKKIMKHPIINQIPGKVVFWKTNEWGSYKGATLPPLQVPEVAYIEFLRSSSGDLRGVVISHRTILHQMRCLTAMMQSQHKTLTRTNDRVLCSLDVRRSTGMILGIFLTVYGGNQLYFLSPQNMRIPGLYAHVASKLKATILLSDYPALKGVCYNYQTEPNATRKFARRHDPNLSHVRWCLVDVLTIDSEFLSVLTDRWLRPLGHHDPKSVVAPTLTVAELGGMVIATKDFLTPQEGRNEVFLNKKALSCNRIEIVEKPEMGSNDELSVMSFGYPIPDANVAIVDPETCVMSQHNVVGEIWIDSPSLDGAFWDHPEDTKSTFHSHCYDSSGELPMEFLRTGLLGFLKDGKVFVLGTRSDRLYQLSPVPKYYYSYQLLETLMRSVPDIYDGCVFQIPLRLPNGNGSTSLHNVVLLESPKSPIKPKRANVLLEEMANHVIAVLRAKHEFNVYAVVLSYPGSAPRTIQSGKPDIAKVAARRQFLKGQLQASHIKFNIVASGIDLPQGDDIKGGIWGKAASYIRNCQLESYGNEKQFSGVDMRSAVVDDRMFTPLDEFKSLSQLLQWRIKRQPDELAYLTIGVNSLLRETSWRKLGQQVGAVYHYITNHLQLRKGDVACLMYTQSEDYVHALYACFLAGIIVIPIAPINLDRITEDVTSLLAVIKQFNVTSLLGNSETYNMMEDKALQIYLKRCQTKIPKLHNTSKVRPSEENKPILSINPPETTPHTPALIWLNYSADHEYTASIFDQRQLLGMCKIQKETCQMNATSPIIGCVRSVSGLGFLYTCCLGVYVGVFTILLSPVDFANNPNMYFVVSSRYKVKNGYGTKPMLQHAIEQLGKPKGFHMGELNNLIISQLSRADLDLVNKTYQILGPAGLEAGTINVAYGPICNPMATTRSYMFVDSTDFWLDPTALRQGLINIVDPNQYPHALHLSDSGMVPINTQVAIVNPETLMLCRTGELGEIWVLSEGNHLAQTVQGLKSSKGMPGVTEEIKDGEPGVKYMRTGDLGFLHNFVKDFNVEMQVLVVAGSIKNTFEFNGLQYFSDDIEETVNASNKMVLDSVVAICNGILCCIVETAEDPRYLPSLAAVIVNNLLVQHQLALNVLSFVSNGSIPRSRLREKQRKKVLQMYTGHSGHPKHEFEIILDFTVNPIDF